MSETKRDTGPKRQSILDAAIQAFSDEGYDATSMDRIADRAGASKRTVYNHFPSKDALFQAVIDCYGREMHAFKEIRYDSARSLAEQLGEFADAELAVVNHPTWQRFFKVLLAVFIRDPELARQAMARHEPGEDTLVTWVAAAAADGRLSVADPQLAARVFSAMVGGAFTWPSVYRGFLDPETIKDLKKELIETFLCRYG